MKWKIALTPRQFLKGLTGLAALGFLVSLAFSLNTLFASRSQQRRQTAGQPQPPSAPPLSTPTPVATDQADSTAGWKVYTDAEVGLSLKYPPDWRLTPGRYIDTSKNFYEIRFDQSYVPIYRGITILVQRNLGKVDTRAFIQQQAKDLIGKGTNPNLEIQQMSVAGVPAFEVHNMKVTGSIAVYVLHKSDMYRFALEEGRDGMAVAPRNGESFYQMLRTVSFR
jgi:hypothetical protein